MPDTPLSHDVSTVFLVDTDPSTRELISRLAKSMQLKSEAFDTGSGFLGSYDDLRPGCLVTEVRTLEIGGIEIQRSLAMKRASLPVIFLSKHGTVPVVVEAMQLGAIDFLEKPPNEQRLWEALQKAMQEDRLRREAIAKSTSRAKIISDLSQAEHRMLDLISEGKSVRAMAEDLGVSARTIENRRNRLMDKIGVETYVELLRFTFEVIDKAEKNTPAAKSAVSAKVKNLRRIAGQ